MASTLTENDDLGIPHAYHLNLPPHHIDKDGIPYITHFANKKARMIVKLVHSIQLSENLFVKGACNDSDHDENGDINDNIENMDVEGSVEDEVDDEDDDNNFSPFSTSENSTLNSIVKKCGILQSQLSTLESLKHNGISQLEQCEMILHILKLLSATVTYSDAKSTDENINSTNNTDVNGVNQTNYNSRKVKIHYDNLGYIYKGVEDEEPPYEDASDLNQLEHELKHTFALPVPAREILLFFLLSMLGNKGPLRSASNAALYATDDNINNNNQHQPRILLFLRWKPLLRMLLRTAPYLDEHKIGNPPKASNSRQNNILQRTVQLIRDARHFFDQGIRPPQPSSVSTQQSNPPEIDKTAREIWNMVKKDVLFHSHTHACYRSTILLYLFQPSRCTSQYYLEVLPYWVESWTNIDRCPEYDFLWLALFCRARKHISPTDFDWGPIRRRILTLSQYWLQLPIGGVSLDKTFPRAANPRSRSCPSRLKDFAGAGSSYEEGIDFVAKITKLLVNSIGTGSKNANDGISEGTRDILRFLNFVTPYFNPSNLGSWTFTLGAFLHYFSYELCCRVGNAAGMEALKISNPSLSKELCDVQPSLSFAAIPGKEMVALLDSLLPLCQQALYSKNGHVGRAGEAAMLYLIQIDPTRSTPAFIDFATSALDISAVNLSHQAPAALSALTRLIQPALRNNPCILLSRLPEILRLCLAGIDRNDQNKTIRTLILYRSITSWIPVGGKPSDWKSSAVSINNSEMLSTNGTMRLGKQMHKHLLSSIQTPEYRSALDQLPPTSILKQSLDTDSTPELLSLLMEEVCSATSDWVLEFLDRIFTFLRASGEREKAGKTSSGVASRHSSVDVQQARNFSRVLKECLMQVFSATVDEEVHMLAVRSVARFLREDTLPLAAKDASYLCQAVAGARNRPKSGNNTSSEEVYCPGLDTLVPILTDDLEHHSTKTLVYRLRCLSGAIRYTGRGIIKHKAIIKKSIDFALASNDKHLFKTGCKLLRHTLSCLCESYPLASDSRPRTAVPISSLSDDPITLGRSAQFDGDTIQWNVPDTDTIEFAWELISCHALQKIKDLCGDDSTDSTTKSNGNDSFSSSLDMQQLRRCLRVIRYCLRGGTGILLDCDNKLIAASGESIEEKGNANGEDDIDVSITPHEQASLSLLNTVSPETRKNLLQIRGRLCSFLVGISSIIGSEMFYSKSFSDTVATDVSSGADSPAVQDRRYSSLISYDAKICKEVCDISLLLLTRRGANFRSQEAKNIWKAQKQSTTDFSLCAMSDFIAESLQRGAYYCDSREILYKDGEDGGKTIPRRLLVSRLKLFHESLQRNASFEVPRRLRRLSKMKGYNKNTLFQLSSNSSDVTSRLAKVLITQPPGALDGYDGLLDGLFTLCCHSHTQVRAAGIGVVDYAITRFGWLISARIPRLLSAISLEDDSMNGKFGIPSCSKLLTHVDGQGKRKRLAEAIKGVCSLLSLPRTVKELMRTDASKFRYIKAFCLTDNLISLLPPEEIQKMVHYLQGTFSKFRSKFYQMPRISAREQKIHEENLHFLLDILFEKEVIDTNSSEQADKRAAHWRKLLLVCWFLMSLVDEVDLRTSNGLSEKIWKTCFYVLENNMAQPLQRLALGLFGRLVALIRDDIKNFSILRDRMVTESFCKLIGHALVYDHKEDANFGGGHDAQWSAGVEDVIRDASRNVAPRSLFPFQRTSQSSTTFKTSHAQFVSQVLVGLGIDDARIAAQYLLTFAKGIASSPPSEDQRNQICTSAEIFSGVCRALILLTDEDGVTDMWNTIFLPYLEEVTLKVPVSFIGAYFDSIRFALQFSPPNAFYALTAWLFGKVESTLWQPKKIVEHPSDSTMDNGEQKSANGDSTATGTDGFTSQSKWLYLCCALLIEIDETEVDGTMSRIPWYASNLVGGEKIRIESQPKRQTIENLEKSWNLVSDKLLPHLTAAIGHPYESCRDHIAGCLFRICHCHRKKMRASASRSIISNNDDTLHQISSNNTGLREDPGTTIVKKLQSLANSEDWSFNDRFNALITTRRFFSYCIHLGEAKHEFSDFIIPLMPQAFEALKSTVEAAAESTDPAQRALEAEVVKGYRYTVAELSITSVISYGRDEDITRVLQVIENASKHEFWQVRHATAHFLRCFQGGHKFLFGSSHESKTLTIVTNLLADDRREVSSAAMAALTGILAASQAETIAGMVKKYVKIANRSKMKGKRKGGKLLSAKAEITTDNCVDTAKEEKRAKNQLSSVFFLCASVMARPYDTPPYLPEALAAISKHSFERNAPLGVRDTVKKCCAEYKRTHMSDNWELHRRVFTREQLESFEDVVSTPHYYA